MTAICRYFAVGLERTSFRAGCPVAAVAHEAYDDPELSQVAQDVVDDWTRMLAELARRHLHLVDVEVPGPAK